MSKSTRNLKNGITWTGFDKIDNNKIWHETKGYYTYIIYQPNEFMQEIVTITEINKDNFEDMKQYRCCIPINAKTKPHYSFYLGKEYYMLSLKEAINFLYKHFEEKRKNV